jgi:hypothetical protein
LLCGDTVNPINEMFVKVLHQGKEGVYVGF